MKKHAIPRLTRHHFLDFAEVTDFVEKLAAACPDLVSLGTLGVSREGRPLYHLTITDSTTGVAHDKPAYLIHANIHASELSGTHAALATARRLVADHPKSDLLKRVAFHIVPRLNPDGAEFVVKTSGKTRSRTDRSQRLPNTLYQQDINGDGLILTMRQQHPDGQFVVDPKDRRLLIQRTRDSKPPFYRTLPEGLIVDWDGSDNIRIEGRSFDWNRNWSYDWRPEPEQGGAGDFPFSEPEMRAMAGFIHSRPNLFGILGYHNGPAATLRPPSTGADSDLDPADLRELQDLARMGARYTGLPEFAVVKYHRQYNPDLNLRGHFHNFGYHHLGLFVFEFELGILLNSAGINTTEIFGIQDTQQYETLLRRMMAWWDRQTKRDPIFRPWKRFRHPQLGNIEIGGLLARHTGGPTLDDLQKIIQNTYRFTVEHASRHPWVKIEDLCVERVGEQIVRVRARVANRGQFPTHVSNKGRNLERLRKVEVGLRLAGDVTLLSREGHVRVGHLAGLTGSRTLEWFLKTDRNRGALGEIAVSGGAGGNCCETIRLPQGIRS